MTQGRAPTPRWVTLLAPATWLTTLLMGLGITWVASSTDFLQVLARLSGASPNAVDVGLVLAAVVAVDVTTMGYATVGALLAVRPGARRIGVILLAGGALFALVPFGYMVGGHLSIEHPGTTLFQALLIMGPVAIGPGYATILPALAIAFPDGRLPAPRWRWFVAVPAGLVALGTLVQILRPDAVSGGPFPIGNPFAISQMPMVFGQLADVAVAVGVMALTVLGIAAVIVRYRRGSLVERQQQRWFVAGVLLAALPLASSIVPGTGGPGALLVAMLGLMLIPISVGIAVTRYRLYEIDRLINRTLVYVPLTAIVAGMYAAVVALLQRVFQSVTGDRSDAAIVISTLILASVFTPLRKWLEGVVDRRFKTVAHPPEAAIEATGTPEWEGRVAAIALGVVRRELASTSVREPVAVDP